ncbi:MAG: ABC transporter permease [Lachnospiraceae bacterium]|nr:ABC transporter permease [Lachnospiraceae bacterium]
MIVEYFADALRNIRNNKLRTALTMLGIIIGIASVIAVLTIGDGMTAYVQNEMGSFSSNIAMMMVDTTATSEKITPDDLKAFNESVPGLMGATYDLDGFGVLTGRRAAVDVSFDSGSSVLEHYQANKLLYGHYFTEEDVENHAAVCVMPERDAKKLCGSSNAVGQTVEFNYNGQTKTLTIVGIRENFSEAILSMLSQMPDYTAFMELPYTTFADMARIDVESGISQAILFGKTGSDMNTLTRTATRLWRDRHGVRDENALFTASMNDISDQIDTIFGAITTFMSFVAAISLLVGGIGVMNIMLVSVTERTREIGIRKSIGARTSAILVQFLAESAIISLMGGIVGVALGIAIAAVTSHLLEFTLVVNPRVVVMATVYSTLIGLFFGLHPARKAAKMRPIDALRF